MKKFILLILSFIFAFITVELILRYIIGFPLYGVDYKIAGIKSTENGFQNIYFPHSNYWTVEGGNNVYKRNNMGLPGIDIDISSSEEFILVVGDSYVESYPINPENMHTSLFQNFLLKDGFNKFKVVNLGVSGNDIYDMYLRLLYYEDIFKPFRVYLIFSQDYSNWLKRHRRPFTFDKDKINVYKIKSSINFLNLIVRNNIALANLFAESLKVDSDLNNDNDILDNKSEIPETDSLLTSKILVEFKSHFEEKVSIVSIMKNCKYNKILQSICQSINLPYYFKELNIPDYKINRTGHLNLEGSKQTAMFLYEIFKYQNR